MIIGIDLRTITPEINNGVNVYTYNLVKNLLIKDKLNNYKLFFNRQKTSNLFPNIGNQKSYNFNIPNKILNGSLKFFKRPKIDKLLGGVDIYWLPNLNFISLSSQTKLIITIHDLSFKLMPELYSSKRRLWHKFINLKKILARSSLILTVSENTKIDLKNYFKIEDKKIKVIYPGVEDIFEHKTEENIKISFKNNYQLSDNFFLSLATLEPRKNFETVILAFVKLLDENQNLIKDNWQLVLVGAVGWLEKSIYKLINKGKYSNRIKIINKLSRDQLPIIYQLSKAFIWPSYYEGFGFPPLEAANYNKAIITSFNSSLVEILGKNTIYINPFNINELKCAMIELIKIDYLKVKSDIKNKYNWDNSADLLMEVFNSINK